jgi:isocitrate dehydrogenase
MEKFQKINTPKEGTPVTAKDGILVVPDDPVICFINGDGVGPEITGLTLRVLDAAVKKAYGRRRKIVWLRVYAGKDAMDVYGETLPHETIEALRDYRIALKGPLETPVGSGMRSLNVAIRQNLSLYACVRPVKYLPGVPSPVRHPERVNMIVFRENMEDLYAGIEWQQGSPEALKVIAFLNKEMGTHISTDSGLGVKPMSVRRSKALVRAALDHAVGKGRKSVTLVTKGNIMKFTEGAFRTWGYEVAQDEYGDRTITEKEVMEKFKGRVPEDRIVVKDRLADNMLQQVLLFPEKYDVIATPNLNGDYISDALAAQVGGLGMTPGANVGDQRAVFEATHGTAPDIAGMGVVNPTASILSGALMLEYLGWQEAGKGVHKAVEAAITTKGVTRDLALQIKGATELSTQEFGEAVLENLLA